jgi:hypothetical protein
MTLCSESILVNQGNQQARAVTLYCRSWNCDICAPNRRSQLIASIISGKPERFITLTIRPTPNKTAAQDAAFMALSLRQLLRLIRKKWPNVDHQYFVVFEAHVSGRPHMHLVMRGCYMPWNWLKARWRDLTGSTHVHIKGVDRNHRTAAYMGKYMGKDVGKFGTCKRYWHSKNWELDPPEERDEQGVWSDVWEPRNQTLHALAAMWHHMGWLIWREGETLYGGLDPPTGSVVISHEEVW